MRYRFLGISDLIAAEGKYLPGWLVKLERKAKKITKSGAVSAEDLATLEFCKVFKNGLTQGHVYDMVVSGHNIKQWQARVKLKYHRSMCREGSLSSRIYRHDMASKQRYSSSTFHVSRKLRLRHFKNSHWHLEAVDFCVVETESSEDSLEEDTVLIKAQTTSLCQEMVHLTSKIWVYI